MDKVIYIRIGMDMDADLHLDANIYPDADADTNSESAIQSHMMKFLHEDHFLGFVDRVETSLSSNHDCSNINSWTLSKSLNKLTAISIWEGNRSIEQLLFEKH